MVSIEEKLRDQKTLNWLKTVALNDFLAIGLFSPIIAKIVNDSVFPMKQFDKIWTVCKYAQLFGGLAYGILGDDISNKRNLFALTSVLTVGAYVAISFAPGNFTVLATSCIILAFVKQTLLVVTSSITEITTTNKSFSRFIQLGQLSAISIFSSFACQPASAFLQTIHGSLPLFVSVGLLLRNIYIASNKLPAGRYLSVVEMSPSEKARFANASFLQVLTTPAVLLTIAIKVTGLFIEGAISTRNVADYYKQRFTVGSISLGLWSGFGTFVGVVVNWFFISKAIQYCGGEARTIESCLCVLALTQAIEYLWPKALSFYLFVFISMLPHVAASNILTQASTLLLTQLVPIGHLGKVFGALNILMSIAGKIAPDYGTFVHSIVGGWSQRGFVAAVHFLLLALAVGNVRNAGLLSKSPPAAAAAAASSSPPPSVSVGGDAQAQASSTPSSDEAAAGGSNAAKNGVDKKND